MQNYLFKRYSEPKIDYSTIESSILLGEEYLYKNFKNVKEYEKETLLRRFQESSIQNAGRVIQALIDYKILKEYVLEQCQSCGFDSRDCFCDRQMLSRITFVSIDTHLVKLLASFENKNARRVFISFRSADTLRIAMDLKAQLEKCGLSVFLSASDLNSGPDFVQMRQALLECHVFLYLESENYFSSAVCMKEFDQAVFRGKRILRLLVADCQRAPGWFEMQYINVNGLNSNLVIDKLLDWELGEPPTLENRRSCFLSICDRNSENVRRLIAENGLSEFSNGTVNGDKALLADHCFRDERKWEKLRSHCKIEWDLH